MSSNARTTFREFFDSFNREVQQARVRTMVVTPDSGRAAQKKDVMDWVNQSLSTLAHTNPLFWRRAQLCSPIINGDKYVFSLSWQQIESIMIDNVTYQVGPANDQNTEFYTLTDNEIVSRSGLMCAGTEVMLIGTFRPIKLIYVNDLEACEDMNQVIDIDESWIELLLLMVINRHAGRQRENYPQLYTLKEQLLDRFSRSFPNVITSSEQGNQIPYGDMGNIRR